jgi:hypothetical protein
MKSSQSAIRLFLTLLFAFVCMASASLAQTGQLKVDRSALDFDAHDIGTSSPLVLTVANNGQASANLAIVLTGDDSGEFSWNSTCLVGLVASGTCKITVSFAPLKITKEEKRKAQLVVSTEKGESQTLSLTGSAYQNLGVSPSQLRFEDQTVEKSASPQTVVVTNYSDAAVPSIAVSATGDFTETHSKCEKLAPGAACAISVVFLPKTEGAATGSLTISADRPNLGKLPRLVLLDGKGISRCSLVPISFWSWDFWLVLLVSGLYFVGLVLVRWHMIAKPARAQLVTQVQAVRANLRSEMASGAATAPAQARAAQIEHLLDWALYTFKYPSFPVERGANDKEISHFPGYLPWPTRLFNALFWPRGQELAAWNASHEAELLLVEVFSDDHVRARLETSEQRLRALNIPTATSLADLVKQAISPGSNPASGERLRALLAETLAVLYEHGDRAYFDLATWHSKMMWLVGSALLLIFALAMTLQNAILLLLGAVGGLLSRLARTVSSADTANDYGATWGALFLSPLSGALSAWGGVLLIVLGLKFNILGGALNVDWCRPYEPATLALALLFGFSERLFDGIATQIDQKISKTQPDSSSKGTPTPTPSPSPTGATKAPANQEIKPEQQPKEAPAKPEKQPKDALPKPEQQPKDAPAKPEQQPKDAPPKPEQS